MRVAVITMAVFLAFGAVAFAQNDSSKQSQKQSPPQQSNSQTSSRPSPQTASPPTENPDDLLNSPQTPTPGAKPESQPKATSSSNSQSSDNPDDLLKGPMTPPRSDKPASEQFPFPEEEEKGSYSSSKDAQGDLSPPRGDSLHPGGDIKSPNEDVQETKPWNPHEADKDVEVGTYYFKRGNFKAAEARYRDALTWQDNHAEAMYRLGSTLQKEGRDLEARMYYEQYLKILPKGEFAAEIRKEIEKMDASDKTPKKASTSPSL